jgi:hypothetical protein
MISCGTQTETVSPSPIANTQTPKQADGEIKKTTTLRLKAQQSIRNLFQKKEAPATESAPTTEGWKRTSLASSGRALAKRISKNFSKTHLPDDTPQIPQSELENLTTLTKRRSIVDYLVEPSSNTATERTAYLDPATAAIVTEIIDITKDTAAGSSEGMRSIDIVELIVESATHAKESHKNASKLDKITREAVDTAKISEQYTDLANEATDMARQFAIEAAEHEGSARQASDMADGFWVQVGEYTRKGEEIEEKMKKANEELEALLEGEFEDERLRGLVEKLKAVREKEGWWSA